MEFKFKEGIYEIISNIIVGVKIQDKNRVSFKMQGKKVELEHGSLVIQQSL